MQHCTQYYYESSAAASTFAATFRLVQVASKVRVRNQRGISEDCGRSSAWPTFGSFWAEAPP